VKVVTIAAAKGGSCKSTACLSLAVAAVQEGLQVALFDLNADQGDLTKWWKLRASPRTPPDRGGAHQQRYRGLAQWEV
jgi:cellulose biosynthesis protein BcsQ